MAKYRKKSPIVEVITFDEFVEYGRNSGNPIYNGMCWSFEYNGIPVTHEDDNRYSICTSNGILSFTSDDILFTYKNKVYVRRKYLFDMTYELISE
jgi:hypothetical protein